MTQEISNSKKGFTIIEVVLVLAIAGLIFLMVFIALPALQRSQRDTQRRNDMSRFSSQLSQYQSNNKGGVPTGQNGYTAFITNYLNVGGDEFNDPSGQPYTIGGVVDCSNATNCTQRSGADGEAPGTIYIYTSARCNGENPERVSGARKIAFTLKLEGAGIYCGNN